jgi:hypothetical protein
MLHITNGDSVAGKLQKAGLEGTFLPWREDYTEGPVAADMRDEHVRQERARFFADTFGIPEGLYQANRDDQEAALQQAAAAGEEIVLWFEHDLYDQTMLACLLHRLAQLEAEGSHPPLRLQLILIGSYPGIEPFHGLGQLTAEQLAQLYPERRPITAAQLQQGRRAWEAYASPDPTAVERLIGKEEEALPHLKQAFTAHLQRFPWTTDGLGRVERLILEAVAQGTHELIPLFRTVTGPLTEYGIGDTQFWAYLDRLRQGPNPLIRIRDADHQDAALPRFGEPFPAGIAVRLTPDGQELLGGGIAPAPGRPRDQIRLNGISRILGGVRLAGTGPLWRWNPATASLTLA